MVKRVRFQSIKCIKPSSGIDQTALSICKGLFTWAGTLGFVGGGMSGAVPIAVAGAGVVALTQASAATINAIAQNHGGEDQLYVKVNGRKVWPGGKWTPCKSQREHALNLVYDLTSTVELALYEWDSGSSDDFMGHVRIDPSAPVGSVSALVAHEPEASVYVVNYEVFEQA